MNQLSPRKLAALETEVLAGRQGPLLRKFLLDQLTERNETQEAFSLRSGVSKPVLSKFFSGKHQGSNYGPGILVKLLTAGGLRFRLEELPTKGQK